VADGFYQEHDLLAGAGQPLVPARTHLAGAAMNAYYVIAIWAGMALLASLVSIRLAIPAALAEIVVGALAGNIPGIQQHITQTGVVTFLASAGSWC
jgi:Kef-type K+ transport system membrane component KefB